MSATALPLTPYPRRSWFRASWQMLVGTLAVGSMMLAAGRAEMRNTLRAYHNERTSGLSAVAPPWASEYLKKVRFASLQISSLERDERNLEWRASLSVVAEDFDRARYALEGVVVEQGGYLAEVNVVNPGDSARELAAAIRVPSPRLPQTLDGLRKLGRVEQDSQSALDVSAKHMDLNARLVNSRRTEQRLLDVLSRRTGKVQEIIEAEMKIAEARESIEKMEAEFAGLEHRIRFAAVELKIREDYRSRLKVVEGSPSRPAWNSLVSGLTTAVESLTGIGLFLLEYAPALLLWFALLFFPARFAWRRLRRATALAEQRF